MADKKIDIKIQRKSYGSATFFRVSFRAWSKDKCMAEIYI